MLNFVYFADNCCDSTDLIISYFWEPSKNLLKWNASKAVPVFVQVWTVCDSMLAIDMQYDILLKRLFFIIVLQ